MIDSDFDPYEELLIAKHNIGELIKGLNHQSHLFRDLSQQHIQLVELNKSLTKRIDCLEREIHSLKIT